MIKQNKGYVLIEIAIFIIIISMMCVSLTVIISNKISINSSDFIDTKLYLTAKSTIGVLEDYFSENKELLIQYSKNNENGSFKIEEREDIKSILVDFSEFDTKTSLVKVTVVDNINNQVTLTVKIPYNK